MINFPVSTKWKICEWKNTTSLLYFIPLRTVKLTSWRFWKTLHLQLIHKVWFKKISYRHFDIFLYNYGKKDFRKINTFFFHLCFLSISSLPSRSPSWGIVMRQSANKTANSANLDFQTILDVGWLIEQGSLEILQRQENLTVLHLLHVAVGGIKNWTVKLLTSPKVSCNQVDDCMSPPSHLGLAKSLMSFKN